MTWPEALARCAEGATICVVFLALAWAIRS